MRSGRPPKGNGVTVETNRTRARNPRALAEAAAVAAMLAAAEQEAAAEQPGGPRVFSLHGQPLQPATIPAAQQDCIALALYRSKSDA